MRLELLDAHGVGWEYLTDHGGAKRVTPVYKVRLRVRVGGEAQTFFVVGLPGNLMVCWNAAEMAIPERMFQHAT